MRKHYLVLITLALAAWVSTGSAQNLWEWSDTFDNNNTDGWMQGTLGQIGESSQQFHIWGTFGPTPTNSPADTYALAYHSIPTAGPLPDQQTLEARADLVGVNQNGTFASLQFFWYQGGSDARAYALFKDQDEIGFFKSWNGAQANAFYFWTNAPTKNTNVTLVLSLTRFGSDLSINTRVLDKDNANAVLFDRTVMDTPQSDPVLPNRAVKGLLSVPDLVGNAWPVTSAPGYVELGLGWLNPQSASQGAAQVIYDNLQVRQYESPQLTIQDAVVLSWPITQGQFILESASDVQGPWDAVPSPWWRTNNALNEVSIRAPDSMKFFRLRHGP